MFDEADEQVKFYLEDEFVSWRDQIEGVHEFLAELDQQKVVEEEELASKGNTIIRNIKGENRGKDLTQVEFSVKSFNPFDQSNIKTQEAKNKKLYIERDTLDEDLTIGTTTPSDEFTSSDERD